MTEVTKVTEATATETKAELVPFGKYKDQPVEVLLADESYLSWLLGQGWFKQRYVTLYQTVINYGGAPQDSPEHNQMQLAYLDNELCLALAKRLLHPDDLASGTDSQLRESLGEYADHFSIEETEARLTGRKFEDRGWDVTFEVIAPSRRARAMSTPPCTCERDHGNCIQNAVCNGGAEPCREEAKSPASGTWNHKAPCVWRRHDVHVLFSESHHSGGFMAGSVRVELKPDLGDDFPNVLRQVLRYPSDLGYSARCVIVRRHSFEAATWDQVKQMFADSGVVLLREQEIAEGR